MKIPEVAVVGCKTSGDRDLLHSTELFRRFAGGLLEEFGEILRVQNAAMRRYGLHLQIGRTQELSRRFHAFFAYVGGESLSRFLFEHGGQIPCADTECRG